MFGAADARLPATGRRLYPLHDAHDSVYLTARASAAGALGGDAFAAVHAEGRALSIDAAVALALD